MLLLIAPLTCNSHPPSSTMQSSSRLCLLGILLALLALCTTFSSVSADGSIQAFIDSACSRPLDNATTISFVSDLSCQNTRDSSGNPIAFIYFCNTTNFDLTFWYNATSCLSAEEATWHVESDQLLTYCPVALYEDADDKLFFYSTLQCTASWPAQHDTGKAISLESFKAITKRVVQQTQQTINALQGD